MAHRVEDRPALTDAVQITPQMIEAGADAIWELVDGDYVRLSRGSSVDLAKAAICAALTVKPSASP